MAGRAEGRAVRDGRGFGVLGWVLVDGPQYSEGADIVASAEDKWGLLIEQAASFIDEKAYDRAKALLISLPKKWQKQNLAQAYLGYAQFYLEEYEEAISCFDFVLEDKINAENILFMRALAKDYLDQVPAAIADYERVLQINPRAELVHRNLGLLYETAGKPVEARKYYRQALEIDSEDESSRQRLKVA